MAKRKFYRYIPTVVMIQFDGRPCAACGSRRDTSIDHRIPLAKGGAHHHSNWQVLCKRCNSFKGGRLYSNEFVGMYRDCWYTMPRKQWPMIRDAEITRMEAMVKNGCFADAD